MGHIREAKDGGGGDPVGVVAELQHGDAGVGDLEGGKHHVEGQMQQVVRSLGTMFHVQKNHCCIL